MNQRRYAFATAPGAAKALHWTQHDPVTWKEFLAWLDLAHPGDRKECGGYVAALLRETTHKHDGEECVGLHRLKEAVEVRSMVTLDSDHGAGPDFVLDVGMELGCAMVVHSTWNHTPDEPRWRVIIPLSEDVKPDDHRLIVDALMGTLGTAVFDTSARQPERFMYRPSAQGRPEYHVLPGEPLDVQEWLGKAHDMGLRTPDQRSRYVGTDTYSELSDDHKQVADEYVAAQVELWTERYASAVSWPEHYRENGLGWEGLAYQGAWALAKMAACPWTAMDEEEAEATYHRIIPNEIAECFDDKWVNNIVDKAALYPVDPPPWLRDEFDVWDESTPNAVNDMDDYQAWDINSDLQLGKRVARQYLKGGYLAWGQNRWARWDGRRWDVNVPDDDINKVIREALLDIRLKEIDKADRKRKRDIAAGKDEKAAMDVHKERMKSIARLSKGATLETAKKLARPDLAVRLEGFDGPGTSHLLNCGNGVVNLKTGRLGPHDPELMFTKMTPVDYDPSARHPDWDKCLRALPADATDWMQRKLGQAATGEAPTDEIILFLRGGGENGKTTFLLGVRQALGEFYVTVPDKVLNGSPGDHTTEFMPLKGARLAVIEELPAGEWIDGTRLKKALGSETGMTARPVNQDNVTWTPSHALVATTNHLIQVGDTDHGTRRRLCDFNFPHTFTGEDRDAGIKHRMKEGAEGQHKAALAWLVAGAVAAYAQPLEREHMPVSVRADTDAWLASTNQAEEFLAEAIVYDAGTSVLSSQVYALYRDWALAKGRKPMSDTTFWERARTAAIFTMPEVAKGNTRDYGELITGREVKEGKQRVLTCVRYTPEYNEKVFSML